MNDKVKEIDPMAGYEGCSYEQAEPVPVSYGLRILPGTFVYTLCEVKDSYSRIGNSDMS